MRFEERQSLKQHLHPVLQSREIVTPIVDTYEIARRIVLCVLLATAIAGFALQSR